MNQNEAATQISIGNDFYKVHVPQIHVQDGRAERMSLWIERSSDGGSTWARISLSLDWSSRIRFALVTPSRWPPEVLDCVKSELNQLTLYFRDQWYPFDKQAPLSSVERESEWKATYQPSANHWVLERIRSLDYEGVDRPP